LCHINDHTALVAALVGGGGEGHGRMRLVASGVLIESWRQNCSASLDADGTDVAARR
jgi:hypothetical protein